MYRVSFTDEDLDLLRRLVDDGAGYADLADRELSPEELRLVRRIADLDTAPTGPGPGFPKLPHAVIAADHKVSGMSGVFHRSSLGGWVNDSRGFPEAELENVETLFEGVQVVDP